MELKQALQILSQLADLTQSKGLLTLDDAVLVKQAKDVVVQHIQDLEKENNV